jgi:hypothetical protein
MGEAFTRHSPRLSHLSGACITSGFSARETADLCLLALFDPSE